MADSGQSEPSAAGRHESVTTLVASSPEAEASEEDEDYTSSSGSSGDESEHHGYVQRSGSTQQKIPKPRPESDLKSRLSSFLPQIERANRELDDAETARVQRIDDVDESEDEYIEMNLGLGVLTERGQAEDSIRLPSPKDNSDASSQTDEDSEDQGRVLHCATRSGRTGRPKIEEVRGGT